MLQHLSESEKIERYRKVCTTLKISYDAIENADDGIFEYMVDLLKDQKTQTEYHKDLLQAIEGFKIRISEKLDVLKEISDEVNKRGLLYEDFDDFKNSVDQYLNEMLEIKSEINEKANKIFEHYHNNEEGS